MLLNRIEYRQVVQTFFILSFLIFVYSYDCRVSMPTSLSVQILFLELPQPRLCAFLEVVRIHPLKCLTALIFVGE